MITSRLEKGLGIKKKREKREGGMIVFKIFGLRAPL